MQAVQMAQERAQRALVIGLGLTGLSCARYLVRCGYRVVVVDSREKPPMLGELAASAAAVECHTGVWDPMLFQDPGLLVVSPGVSLREPLIAQAISNGIPAVGDIELFARAVAAPVLAVTGVNGKSTVTALVGAMCREAGLDTRVGGNIGVPALSLLEESRPDVYVLELSSFQLETTHSLNAHAATVLNVSRDHMDRYSNVAEYAQAKARIFRGTGVMVLNTDDVAVLAMSQSDRRVVCFGLGPPAGPDHFGVITMHGRHWLAKGDDAWLPLSCAHLQGRHNLANSLAAMALADTLGVGATAMERALLTFTGLPHRTETIVEHGGVLWINDSKATNVGATLAALRSQKRPVVLIAGGDAKGADFSVLRQVVREKVHALVLLGRDAVLIERALDKLVPIKHATGMDEAVIGAADLAQPGDVVLLSPGCASFDMFQNYEHRGRTFTAAVQALVAKRGGS
ncbi:MAG: UDP-N-acetylmuramoyl-L-alanine--D-glutamate ligase [Acidiferrobacterales bacterium]